MKKILIALTLVLGFSSCNLINSLIGGSNPSGNGKLGIALQAPATQNASVVISTVNFKKTYSDDGRGFATRIELPAGRYDVLPSQVSGYTAVISITDPEFGNSSVEGSTNIEITTTQDKAVVISYKQIKP